MDQGQGDFHIAVLQGQFMAAPVPDTALVLSQAVQGLPIFQLESLCANRSAGPFRDQRSPVRTEKRNRRRYRIDADRQRLGRQFEASALFPGNQTHLLRLLDYRE